MKLRDILDEGKSTLAKNKIEDPDFDATEILLNLLDMDMARFLFECEDELEDKYDKRTISNIITDFDELISARAQHFPLQYILGESYFCGLKFNIGQGVLIPRQDTEILVEKVIADNQDKNKFILDSKEPNFDKYKEFLDGEVRYSSLALKDKEKANILGEKNMKEAMARYNYLKALGNLYAAQVPNA